MIGYLRVSRENDNPKLGTVGEVVEQAGLLAQRKTVEQGAARLGLVLDRVDSEILSAGSMKRPVLLQALEDCRVGVSDGIIVAKLDRLSRSVIDFADMLARAKTEGWNIVALDFGLDLWTPQGELVANVLMSVAQWERRIIGQRTSEALQALKRQGVRLGRQSTVSPELAAEILELRAAGLSYRALCAVLNERGEPTPGGGLEWRPSSLQHIIRTP